MITDKLEKLAEFSVIDFEEIVKFGSLCSVLVTDHYIYIFISSTDVVADQQGNVGIF